MNSGIAPFMLLAATIGLLLGVSAVRVALIGAGAFVVAALIGFAAPVLLPLAAIFTGLFVTMIVTGILAYLPPARTARIVVPMAVNAGLWIGACAALTSTLGGMSVGLLAMLVAIPAHFVARSRLCILIKVVASWMIAIASLSLFVSLMPTPGYKPDHME